MANIPFTDFGGTGEVIHFAHANGYPPGCYGELIDELKAEHHVLASHFRPLWDDDHGQLSNWKLFSDDMIRYMDQEGMKDVIGVGHSLGAITSMVSAIRRPDLFRRLVLIEPVVLPPSAYLLSGYLPIFLSKKLLPIAKIALNRKDRWESQEALFDSFRKKKVFKGISDNGLRLFTEYATKPSPEGGIQLTYSREWEAQVYCTPIQPWKYLNRLNIPTMIIRGQHTNVLSDSTWNQLQATVKNGTFVDMGNVSHLAPLEAPIRIASFIKEWL